FLLRGEVGKPLNEAAGALLRYLPLLLVPAAVGVMAYAREIAADFWAIVGALVLSLVVSFLFAGWMMQKLIDRQQRRREEP
ncbi:CidA/LrgA family protein, partial [Pseudomonas aeruginosa]|nr:CidA/LrgA family protein [Pseudomonas aeruginosa]